MIIIKLTGEDGSTTLINATNFTFIVAFREGSRINYHGLHIIVKETPDQIREAIEIEIENRKPY